MTNEPILTMVGNLTADPELRYTQNGLPVANLTIAQTPRTFDKQANEWKDGEAVFMRCSVWREFAEHVAGSLTKGMRVIAQGRLVQRSYQDKEGNNRTSMELELDAIGPDLRYATAQVTRAQAGQGGGQQQTPQGYAPQGNYGPPQTGAPQQPQAPHQGAPVQGGYPGVTQAPQQPQAPAQPQPQQVPQQQGYPQNGQGWSQPGQGFDQAPF